MSEIVLPAGAHAVGKLQRANSSGYVSVHFDTLQMSDGIIEKIDDDAIGLDYKPLKGNVTGRRRAARFLVESLTGLGTLATYRPACQGCGLSRRPGRRRPAL